MLPASLGEALARSATAADDWIEWQSASGHVHALRVVRPQAEVVATTGVARPLHDDFAPLTLAGADPVHVTEVVRSQPGDDDAAPPTGRDRAGARAAGTLVHRAIAAGALHTSYEGRVALVRQLGRGEGPAAHAAALAAVEQLATRPDVAAIISGSHVQHEVPVSVRAADGSVARAVVDMLVHRADGSVVVVEFKTGAAREADRRQLAAYAEGIRALDPALIVESRLIRVDL